MSTEPKTPAPDYSENLRLFQERAADGARKALRALQVAAAELHAIAGVAAYPRTADKTRPSGQLAGPVQLLEARSRTSPGRGSVADLRRLAHPQTLADDVKALATLYPHEVTITIGGASSPGTAHGKLSDGVVCSWPGGPCDCRNVHD